MIAAGATQILECGPGKVLTALNRRIDKNRDLKMSALEDPPPSTRRWRWRPRIDRKDTHHVERTVALVTGASRGIGAAIAARLAADGARVIGTATTSEGAARVTDNLEAAGGRGAVLDVTNQESVDAVLADIEARDGAVGILCNNAGITRDMLLVRMKQEDWDAVLQTNLAAVFRLSKAVLRGMMKAAKAGSSASPRWWPRRAMPVRPITPRRRRG